MGKAGTHFPPLSLFALHNFHFGITLFFSLLARLLSEIEEDRQSNVIYGTDQSEDLCPLKRMKERTWKRRTLSSHLSLKVPIHSILLYAFTSAPAETTSRHPPTRQTAAIETLSPTSTKKSFVGCDNKQQQQQLHRHSRVLSKMLRSPVLFSNVEEL